MIIDQFGVFFDNKAAAASMISNAITVMPYIGRAEPVNITVIVKGQPDATLDIRFQESADGATFTEVSSFTLAKVGAEPALLSFPIPRAVKEQYARLECAVSGTSAGLTVFAAVTRDHVAPYDKGLYINRGKVEA